MSVDPLSHEMRQSVVQAADSVLRVGDGCTCLDCQQQAVEIIGRLVVEQREASAVVAHSAALYTGCPVEMIADEIAAAVRAGRVVGSPL